MDAPVADRRPYEELALARLRLAFREVPGKKENETAAPRQPSRSYQWSAWSLVPNEVFVLIASALVYVGIFCSASGRLKPLLRTFESLVGLH